MEQGIWDGERRVSWLERDIGNGAGRTSGMEQEDISMEKKKEGLVPQEQGLAAALSIPTMGVPGDQGAVVRPGRCRAGQAPSYGSSETCVPWCMALCPASWATFECSPAPE